VDHVIWQYALDHDFAVVITNARDFIALLDVPVHTGLIVLRESGLSREEQWEWLRPVVEFVKKSGDDDFLLLVTPPFALGPASLLFVSACP
jgi:hypothetical protein